MARQPGSEVAPYWVIHDEDAWQWEPQRIEAAKQMFGKALYAEGLRRAEEAERRAGVAAEQAARAQRLRDASRTRPR